MKRKELIKRSLSAVMAASMMIEAMPVYADSVNESGTVSKNTGTDQGSQAEDDLTISANMTLTADKTVDDLYVNSGTFNLNGHTLTVRGNVYLSGGYISINKGKLFVDGNFNMSNINGSYGNGYLTMTGSEDYICVNGDFLAYSYYSNCFK